MQLQYHDLTKVLNKKEILTVKIDNRIEKWNVNYNDLKTRIISICLSSMNSEEVYIYDGMSFLFNPYHSFFLNENNVIKTLIIHPDTLTGAIFYSDRAKYIPGRDSELESEFKIV